MKKYVFLFLVACASSYQLSAQCSIQILNSGSCPGDTIDVTGVANWVDPTIAQWRWDFGDGSPVVSGQTKTHYYPYSATPVSYTITLTVSDTTDTCTVTTTVGIGSAPLASFVGNVISTRLCLDSYPCDTTYTDTFTLSSLTPGPWIWDFGDGTPPVTVLNPSDLVGHTYLNLGVYQITVRHALSTCPSVVQTYRVQTRPINPDITPPPFNVCEGVPFKLATNASSQCPGNIEYFIIAWDYNFSGFSNRDTIYSQTNDTLTHIYDLTNFVTGVNPVTILYQAVNGCSQQNIITETAFIAAEIKTNFGFSSPSSFCAPNFTVNFLNTTLGATATTPYTWNFGDPSSGVNNTSTVANPTHIFSGPGVYNVTLTASNGYCGPRSVVRPITILEPPIANITASAQSGCGPLPISFVNNSYPSYNNYLWTITPNQGVTYTSGSDTSRTPVITLNTPGTYIFTNLISNPCGSTIWRDTIVVFGRPIVSVLPLPDSCGPVTYTPIATALPNGTPITSYAWSFGPGSTPSTASALAPGPVAFGAGPHTITLSAFNICGQSSANTSFNLAPPVQVYSGPDTSLCLGNPPICFTPSPPGGNWLLNGAAAPDSCFSPLVQGLYSVVYQIDTFGCSIKDTLNLQVSPLPVVNAGTLLSVCPGVKLVLTGASPAGGIWSGTGVIQPDTFLYTISGTYTLTYTYTDPVSGCQASNTRQVTVFTPPVVNAGADKTYCLFPGTVTITPAGTPSGGTWTGPGVSPTGIFTPGIPGIGTHALVYSNSANGCFAYDTLLATVQAPVKPVAMPDDTVCRNAGLVTLTATPVGGNWNPATPFNPLTAPVGVNTFIYTTFTGTSCEQKDTLRITVVDTISLAAPLALTACTNGGVYTLSGFTPSGGTFSGAPVIDPILGTIDPGSVVAGNYPITYTIIANGCTSQVVRNLVISAPQGVFAGNDTTYCITPTAQPLPIPSHPGGTWTYNNAVVTSPIIPSAYPAGANTFVYTWPDPNGCTNIDSVVVTFNAPQPAVAMPDTSICRNQGPLVLTGSPAGSYAPASPFLPLNAPAGINTFIYTIFPGTSCEQKDTLRVTVKDTVALVAGPALSKCTNDAPFLLAGYTPAGGTWSGAPVVNSLTGLIDPGSVAPGTYTLVYSFTDPSTQCVSTTVRSITIYAPQGVFAGNDTTYCLTNVSQPLPTPSQPGGTWTNNGNVVAAFNPGTFGIGSFTFLYTWVDPNGCTNADSLVVTIVAPQPAVVMPDDTVCRNNGPVILTATPVGGVWNQPTPFPPLTAPSGVNTFIYTIFAGTSCEQKDTLRITVLDTAAIVPGPTVVACTNGLPFLLSGYTPAGGNWSGPGITNGGTGEIDPRTLAAGIYTLVYTYLDINTGCISTSTRSLEIYAPELATFSLPALVCKNDPILFSSPTPNIAGYFWDFGVLTQTNDTSVLAQPTYAFADTGFYTSTLIVTSIHGCLDTTTASLQVSEPPTPFYTPAAHSGCAVRDVLPGINGLSMTFTDGSVAAGGTYLWNFGGGKDVNGLTTFGGATPPVIYFEQGPRDTTYYVTLTISNSCDTVQYVDSILVQPVPVVAFGPNVSQGCSFFCPAWTNITKGSPTSFGWYTDGVLFSNDSIPSPFPCFSYFGNSDTTYTVTLIATNTCGADTADHVITVFPNTVSAFFNTNVTSGCPPFTVTVTNLSGAPNRSFDMGDGTTSLADTVAHTYNTPGTYVISHFVNNGCSFDTAYFTITVFPVPAVNILPQDTAVCPGSPITFVDSAYTGATSGYLWQFGDGNTSQNISPTHSYALPGTYSVIAQATSIANGCTVRDTAQVTVWPVPNTNFTPADTQGCEPFVAQFLNTTTGGNSYYWEFGDGSTSTATSPSHIFPNPGTYFVKLTAFNSLNCSSSFTQPIVVQPKPLTAFTIAVDDSCGVPTFARTQNLSTDTLVSYLWTFGNQTDSSLNPVFPVNQTGTFPVRLITTSAFGCKDTAFSSVTVYPQPVAMLAATPINGCDPLLTQFTNNSTNYTRIWVDLEVDTLVNPPLNFSQIFTAPNGDRTYTVTLIADQQGKCFDTVQQAILVKNTPVAEFALDADTLCGTPAVVNFTQQVAGVTPIASLSWNFGDPSSGPLNTSSANTPSHSFSTTGNFNVSLIAINQGGCRDTVTHPVWVFPQPVAEIEADPVLGCYDLEVTFTLKDPDVATTYAWDFGDGTTGNGKPAFHIYTAAGTFTPQVVVSYQGICWDTATTTIRVGTPPVADYSFVVEGECADSVLVTTTNLSTSADAFWWDFGDGRTSTDRQPLIIYTFPNDYIVTLVAYNTAFGCTDTLRQTVRYLRSIADFEFDKRRGCTDLTVNFYDKSIGVTEWLWDFGDNTPRSTEQNPQHVYTRGGTYTATLFVSYQGVCRDTLVNPIQIEVLQSPVAAFDYINTSPPPGTFQFVPQTVPPVDFFEWDFGDGNTSTAESPTHEYLNYDTVLVTLVTSTIEGCRDTAYVSFSTDVTGLYIPNAMSPTDASGAEYSMFIPKGIGLATFEIAVYDKWGNRLWWCDSLDPRTGSPDCRWDGNVNGYPVTGGGYIWVVKARFKNGLEYKGKQQGTLDILR